MSVAYDEISLVPAAVSIFGSNKIRKGIDESFAIERAEVAPDRNPTSAGIVLHKANRPRIDHDSQRNILSLQEVGKCLHVLHRARDAAFHPEWRIFAADGIAWN